MCLCGGGACVRVCARMYMHVCQPVFLPVCFGVSRYESSFFYASYLGLVALRGLLWLQERTDKGLPRTKQYPEDDGAVA